MIRRSGKSAHICVWIRLAVWQRLTIDSVRMVSAASRRIKLHTIRIGMLRRIWLMRCLNSAIAPMPYDSNRRTPLLKFWQDGENTFRHEVSKTPSRTNGTRSVSQLRVTWCLGVFVAEESLGISGIPVARYRLTVS